jgi:hypothetical protein
MKTLELKYIAGYLPYRLRAMIGMGEIVSILGFNSDLKSLIIEWKISYGYGTRTELHVIKISELGSILLRPRSDLYKAIIHNGKKIIPIVEMAKMHNNKLDWVVPENYMVAVAGKYRFNIDGFGDFTFYYDGVEKVEGKVYGQIELFDFLHELKFDYRGLIDMGLAIDANTLKLNPYK